MIDSENTDQPGRWDMSIIRPEMRFEDVMQRGVEFSASRLRKIGAALRKLHTVELMATTIYRYQITKADSQLNTYLIAAMCNEMTHLQDFQVKVYEYRRRPRLTRLAHWFVGFFIGRGSRMLGVGVMLRCNIWLEAKAVSAYQELLEKVDWDDETRVILEKNQADEVGHIARWQERLGVYRASKASKSRH